MATGGITLNGSSQYLELSSAVATAYPFTIVAWVASALSASGVSAVASQGSSANDAYQYIGYGNSSSSKYAGDRSVASGSVTAARFASPDIASGSLSLMVGVFTSASSRTIYLGSNSGTTDPGSISQNFSHIDRFLIGATRRTGPGIENYAGMTVAEVHVFNVALASGDVTTLLTTKPEEVTGWVDGWILSSNSDLTSIGGTRTLTAVGSPTTASLTLPYTRTAAPVITGPTGAAGASSITTSAAENQNAAGTWTATNSVSWSLSGTDAADLSIAGGVVTKASGNFDYEAKPSYAFNVDNGSATQAVTLNITNAGEPPLAPTIGTATAGNASASVAFTPPTNTGRPAITGYTATSSPGGLTGTGATSPITVSGLTNGTAYTFVVTATNIDGTGPASAASNSVTPSAGGSSPAPHRSFPLSILNH